MEIPGISILQRELSQLGEGGQYDRTKQRQARFRRLEGRMFLGVDFGTTHSSMTVLRESSREPEVVPITPNDEPYDSILRSATFIPDKTKFLPECIPLLQVHDLKFHKGTIAEKKGLLLKHFKPYFNRWTLKTVTREYQKITRYNQLLEYDTEMAGGYLDVVLNGPYSRDELVYSAAAVLSKLKSGLVKLGVTANQAKQILIGNPVGFSGFARNRLLHACYLAGLVSSPQDALRRVRFVYEPVAAACQDVMVGLKSQRVFVFDFGGGTLDLAVVRFEAEKGTLHPAEIEAVEGLAMAGHHIDWKILEYLLKTHVKVGKALKSFEATIGRAATLQILEIIEGLKKDLSTAEDARLPYGGIYLELSRSELNKLMEPILSRIRHKVLGLINTLPAGHGIDRVIAVGGSSLMPAVQDMLRELFPNPKIKFNLPSPSEQHRGGGVEKALTAVAYGLSMYGKRAHLREKTDRSIHVFLADDTWREVLPKGSAFGESKGPKTAAGSLQSLHLPANQGAVTVALYEQSFVGLEYLAQFNNIPSVEDQVDCLCSLEQGAHLPIVKVGGKQINPALMSDEALLRFLEKDDGALSLSGKPSPLIPPIILGLGDEISYQPDSRSGKIVEIIKRDGWSFPRESSPDLSSYLIRVKNKNTQSARLELTASQVQLTQRAEHYRDDLQENLFVDQLRAELAPASG